jgi:hypothetical protein
MYPGRSVVSNCTTLARSKAVSRCACHRGPRRIWLARALVAKKDVLDCESGVALRFPPHSKTRMVCRRVVGMGRNLGLLPFEVDLDREPFLTSC